MEASPLLLDSAMDRTSRGIAARCTWPTNVHSCKQDGRLSALSQKKTAGFAKGIQLLLYHMGIYKKLIFDLINSSDMSLIIGEWCI